MQRLIARAGRGLDTFLPPACVVCARSVDPGVAPICGLCIARLPRVPAPRCPRCGAVATARCRRCLSWPRELVAAAAAFSFAGPAAAVVRALKYGRWRSIAPFMASEMVAPGRALLAALPGRGDRVVVPVPLSPARRRERGFNQAEDLAAGIAVALDLPLRAAIVREGGGGRQAGAGVTGRVANVQGRFRPASGSRVAGGVAVLVDDVLTTGATALACAQALSEAGFSDIGVLTFARTLRTSGRAGHGQTG